MLLHTEDKSEFRIKEIRVIILSKEVMKAIPYIACEHPKDMALPLYLNEAVCHLSQKDHPG